MITKIPLVGNNYNLQLLEIVKTDGGFVLRRNLVVVYRHFPIEL